MKPRASAPSTMSGLRGSAHSASRSTARLERFAVGEQRHDVLEDDARLWGSPGRPGSSTRGRSSLTSRPGLRTSRQKRSCGELLAPARRAPAGPRGPTARRSGLRDAQRGCDELLEQCDLAVGGRAESPQMARRDPEPGELAARERRSPRRSRGSGALPPPTRGASSPNSSSSRARSALIPARSHSVARSSSSSCSARPAGRRRRRSFVVPGAASSWRITRSGRNSSRCRRRIVSRRSTSSSLKRR